MKKTFRIVPLPTEVAEKARRASTPDHQIVIADAPEAFPCRHCLRWADPGEALVLFPYHSIPQGRPYSESGLIFVHREPCERYSKVNEYPGAFRQGRVVRGYDAHDEMIAADGAGDIPEAVIETMLANPEVAYLQVRSVTRGCFTMKAERV
ncbi:MAG: DUF1203 domain-containing protein [Chthoniobacterales bacterium]